ncbi:hypothetical protein HBA55_15445 [Pseudomaricurvus alkylphenolicus]|uniref:T-complex 10 C-terminal domain-containing protein n=1 Tax=Pseudomaricurvus alkylphenolicus TaxID=1306991 RepID=UPI00141FDB94|nr:T-complex 10 C-terminal domain-containing protein [Pseudomaricurvus alkylphenolicus]NIB40997.1 hypothetical protein [Pseudomaricurvus alkylphenolicus]
MIIYNIATSKKISTELAELETFHQQRSQKQVIRRQDGSTETTDADGTVFRTHPDGSTSVIALDGTTEKYRPDGSWTVSYPDGSSEGVNAEGEYSFTTVEDATRSISNFPITMGG